MEKEKKIMKQLPRLANQHISEKEGNNKSITENGISTTQALGQEQYVRFVGGAFMGKIYYQYDYRHLDGELFSTIAETLEECRRRKDEWLTQKSK